MLLEILELYDYQPQLGIAPLLVVAGIVGTVFSSVMSSNSARQARNDLNDQAAAARRDQAANDARIARIERGRAPVIDKSEEIRDMKDDVLNPYQNLGVAMQGVELKMEETDESLANILNSLNKSGVGAGAATQLARQAATSKAQVAATIETQELQNQKLYLGGEAQKMAQMQALEQQAIQEEVAVYGRGEVRTNQMLDRLAGLATGAGQRAADFQAAGQAYGVQSSQILNSGVTNSLQMLSMLDTGTGNDEDGDDD